MRNLMLTLTYDGTNYHGWQFQPNQITVQQSLEDAIFKIFKENITVTGCSRTDAGVHAKQYVCNFFTNCKIPSEKVSIALNTKLPNDIRAVFCNEKDENFNARFDTVSKTYKYIINNGEYDVFTRNQCLFCENKLDIEKMKKAAIHFLGEHDFKAFMTGDKDNTVRKIYSLDINKNGNIVEIVINANGYLYNMVRIIVGTLCMVGQNKIYPDKILDIINSKNRQNAGPTAPAHGLYLAKVFYK